MLSFWSATQTRVRNGSSHQAGYTSPRVWGWTVEATRILAERIGFPTCVGVDQMEIETTRILAERIAYLRDQEQGLVSEVADLRAKLKECRQEMGMLLDSLLTEILSEGGN